MKWGMWVVLPMVLGAGSALAVQPVPASGTYADSTLEQPSQAQDPQDQVAPQEQTAPEAGHGAEQEPDQSGPVSTGDGDGEGQE
ncbi:MAG: hypothetical protein B7Z66_01260 [Chromatiales bacterium 21-64-14]|nr:MAG: hypothetical protein B7Z66_01260 [Chromatiales bacterium 21-64-14]